jgi:hypothetical protein
VLNRLLFRYAFKAIQKETRVDAENVKICIDHKVFFSKYTYLFDTNKFVIE